MDKEKEEIKNSIRERFDNLQPEIKDAIMSSNYEKNLFEIGQKHHLSIEQMGDLELNTTLMMLGDTHPDQYANELMGDLNLPEDKIYEIVDDVNERIMGNIREMIKANFDKDDHEEEAFREMPTPPEIPAIVPEPTKEVSEKTIDKSIINEVKNDTANLQSGINMFKEKLGGITTSKNKVTDYSTPQASSIPKDKVPLARAIPVESNEESGHGIKHDPYHEAI